MADGLARAAADRPQISVSEDALRTRFLRQGLGARNHASRAARRVVALMTDFAREGTTPLAATLGDASPQVWQQYACVPAQARGPGELFFYYHSHARGVRGEHGHFHLFAGLPGRRDDGTARYAHLVGIGVDARGLPQRLFATNRWVTDEDLVAAAPLLEVLDRIIARPVPAAAPPLAAWLTGLLAVFRPQIEALLRHRDARLARRLPRALEDRRMHVLAACRVSLLRQMAVLDAVVD